jgi:uncharacterized membrane protein (UPF0127 family)
VYLVHESADGRRRVLARDVETADSVTRQVLGLMGRSSIPEDYALVFRDLSDPVAAAIEELPWPLSALADDDHHGVHMLFVRTPLDVVWVADDEVTRVETLAPWTGRASARADTLVELAGGAAAGVQDGDRLLLVESLAPDTLRDWRHGGWRDRYRGRRR